jgi:outer membrane protein OmpA-like peptidoglycan-associated protein
MSPISKAKNGARLGTAGFAIAALLATSGCVTDPNTGQQKVSRTAIGAGAGALGGMLLGGLIGGSTGRIVGAGIGGIAGGAIGYERDKQIKQLREQTVGTGVDIRPSDDGRSIMLSLPDGVTFDTGSYMLHPQFRPTLDKIAQSLKDYPNSLIDVYGHTDLTGSAQLNQTLSENRARTVGDYLSMQGVSQARIRTRAMARPCPWPIMPRPKAARKTAAWKSRSCPSPRNR